MDRDIIIRPIHLEDFPQVVRWNKDETFCSANGWEVHRKEEDLHNWWLKCVENSSTSTDFLRMGIEYERRLIGYVDLVIEGHSAEIGIAIGESSLWGRGIGYETIKRMMEYGRKEFGITFFQAETHESNFRSRKMLDKLGFKEVSRVGREVYQGNEVQLIQYVK